LQPLSASVSPHHLLEATLIPKLHVHFAEFLNRGSLVRLWVLPSSTCVGFRYGQQITSLSGSFLAVRLLQVPMHRCTVPVLHQGFIMQGFASHNPYKVRQTSISLLGFTLCVTASVLTVIRWYRNINLFSISYAFRPHLRTRLTLGRSALPRNPWTYGEQISHLLYRYSCRHSHFCCLQHASRHTFVSFQNAPLPNTLHSKKSNAVPSVHCFSPVISSAHQCSTSELLRTLLRIAASKQTSWLSWHRHILSHLAML